MPAFFDAPERTLSVQSTAIEQHLGRPALTPVRLSGTEGVNSLFEYELLLKTSDALNADASEGANFNIDDFVGREISCSIALDGAGEFLPGTVGTSVDRIGTGARQINALISKAEYWGEEGRHSQYRLTLRPWLHLATKRTSTKIYQNKSAIDILDELLGAYAFPVHKILFAQYPARDFQVQYNESDFEFFCRVTEEWGVNYFFEHSDGKHRLVLIDAMAGWRPTDSEAYRTVEYHVRSGVLLACAPC
ncbi:phage late control D family protein [Variovorax ginsengisoli]|uniref:Uncharacterized protein involved in type VI secretion and phage assembly n=1 Tax=Variovorax ginsengisoli TaxID=363844 RepID=A0ABT9SCS3_9BURK|nr:phage late control D family protein [Variovorax ginsengisoli]MDP9902155.1 uncharacterized protein involved in type VI secretion and phage assembly [Variovorax ginsengisoli]